MIKVWTVNQQINGKDIVRTQLEIEDGGFEVSALPPYPSGTIEPGKSYVLTRDPINGDLSWELVDRPLTDREQLTSQVQELKSQNADMIFALVSNNLM